MKLSEIVSLAKVRLQNIVVSKDQSVLISFINLGMSELYRRFNLSVKGETVVTTHDLALYELREPDVDMLLAVYSATGRELRQSDVLDSMDYDYKLINYRSFILRKPFDGYLYTVYKASPTRLTDLDDEVDLPNGMIPALLTYVAYMANSTINRDNQNEATNQYQIFTQQCVELENQGFKIPLNTEKCAVQCRGYV